MAHPLLAEIGIPTAADFVRVLGPVAGLIGLSWIFRHSDAVIHRLFPHWEWERKLGWLNIRAERGASTFFRRASHVVHALLVVALFGIASQAKVLSQWPRWRQPEVFRELSNALPLELICLWLWAAYLLGYLIPKLKREFEEEELARFRAERPEVERARENKSSMEARQWPKSAAESALIQPPRAGR